jgi:pimeloyl-ACP methyl ester carboxylesterase
VSGIVALAPHVFVEGETVAAIADARRRFDEGDLRARLEKQHGSNTETMFRAWSDVWLSPEFASFDVGDLLPHISCPVLAIMGDADPYGTYRQLDVLEARCGGPVQQMRISGARHAPHRQRPEIVIPALAAFVRRLLA